MILHVWLVQAGYSCAPESSADVGTQADIVNGYAQYIVMEDILENYASPDLFSNLLDTINTTLPYYLPNHVSRLLFNILCHSQASYLGCEFDLF